MSDLWWLLKKTVEKALRISKPIKRTKPYSLFDPIFVDITNNLNYQRLYRWKYWVRQASWDTQVSVFGSIIERVKNHFYVNGKREFVPRDQVSRLLFIISTHKLVV